MKHTGVVVFVLLLVAGSAEAAILTAASCSRADVLTQTNAAVDGDTVVIPGSCTWSAAAGITITNKYLTIQGAGIGATTITLNTTDARAFTWSVKAGGLSRVTGITFQGGTTADGGSQDGILHITGETSQLRIDHVRFNVTKTPALNISGYIRGVADHNTFDSTGATAAGGYCCVAYVFHPNWGGTADQWGDRSWSTAHSLGGTDNFFFEDNVFLDAAGGDRSLGVDGWAGQRVVVRFNNFTNILHTNHGTDTGGRYRSARQNEVYRNTVLISGWAASTFAGTRGGTGMTFDNAITTTGGGSIDGIANLSNDRQDDTLGGNRTLYFGPCGVVTLSAGALTSSGTTATITLTGHRFNVTPQNAMPITISGASPAGYNGTFTITGGTTGTITYTLASTLSSPATGTITIRNPYDGNTDATGYRCLDQVGAGQGDLMSGFDPPLPKAWTNQALEPHYFWNNTKNAAITNPVSNSASVVNLRDYFGHNASFNGTTQHGVGVGVRSARPSSCAVGDAWWATDIGSWNTVTSGPWVGIQGVLDKCTATNTWTNAAYTPYQYPHPLVSGDIPPDPPPANVRGGMSLPFSR